MNEFSKTLNRLIAKKEIDLKQLSQETGIPEEVLQDYTADHCPDVRIEYAARLAKFFDASMDELLLGDFHGNLRVTTLEYKLQQVLEVLDSPISIDDVEATKEIQLAELSDMDHLKPFLEESKIDASGDTSLPPCGS